MSDSYVLSSVANSIEHLANSIQFQNHLELAKMGALFTDNLAVEPDFMRSEQPYSGEYFQCKVCKLPLKFVRKEKGYGGAYLHLINFYEEMTK